MKIIKAWADLGFNSPEIHVEPEVNEVWLTLPLYFPCPGLSPAKAITNSLSPMRAEDNPFRPFLSRRSPALLFSVYRYLLLVHDVHDSFAMLDYALPDIIRRTFVQLNVFE